ELSARSWRTHTSPSMQARFCRKRDPVKLTSARLAGQSGGQLAAHLDRHRRSLEITRAVDRLGRAAEVREERLRDRGKGDLVLGSQEPEGFTSAGDGTSLSALTTIRVVLHQSLIDSQRRQFS